MILKISTVHIEINNPSLFRAFSREFLFERVSRTKGTDEEKRRNVLLRAFRDSRNYAAWIIVSKISIFFDSSRSRFAAS